MVVDTSDLQSRNVVLSGDAPDISPNTFFDIGSYKIDSIFCTEDNVVITI